MRCCSAHRSLSTRACNRVRHAEPDVAAHFAERDGADHCARVAERRQRNAGGVHVELSRMGAKPPSPEWGIMLSDARDSLTRAWWTSVFPGVAIMLMAMSINFIGDGLRQA